ALLSMLPHIGKQDSWVGLALASCRELLMGLLKLSLEARVFLGHAQAIAGSVRCCRCRHSLSCQKSSWVCWPVGSETQKGGREM
ncbi:unnamed protein product, partial [Citrullus colocynthis]